MNDEPSVIAQRIGDADRDAAVTALQEHHVAGRLDREEFDTRMTAALAARTQADLARLFVDLPGPVAATPVVAPSPRPAAAPASWQRYGVPALASAIWPLTILACILFSNWALIAIPIIVSMVVGGSVHGGCGGSGRRAQLQSARLSRW